MNNALAIMVEAEKFVKDNLVGLCRNMERRSAAQVLPSNSVFWQLTHKLSELDCGSGMRLAESMIMRAAVQSIAQQLPACDHPKANHHPAKGISVEYWTCHDCGAIWSEPVNQETEDAATSQLKPSA